MKNQIVSKNSYVYKNYKKDKEIINYEGTYADLEPILYPNNNVDSDWQTTDT